jgi:hypothetical protein
MWMDVRVRRGHDGSVFGMVPALRGSVKNAAARPGHEHLYPINCSHGSTISNSPAKYTTPKIRPNFQKSPLPI